MNSPTITKSGGILITWSNHHLNHLEKYKLNNDLNSKEIYGSNFDNTIYKPYSRKKWDIKPSGKFFIAKVMINNPSDDNENLNTWLDDSSIRQSRNRKSFDNIFSLTDWVSFV